MLCTPKDSIVDYTFNGDNVYAISHDKAPKFKLLRISLLHPDWKTAELVAGEKSDLILKSISRSENYLFLTYFDVVNYHLEKFDLKTKQFTPIPTPFKVYVGIGALNKKSNSCFVSISSWGTPTTNYLYDASIDKFTPTPFNKTAKYPVRYTNVETKEVSVKATDGALVPLSIIYKKGIRFSGENVCILECYGAYGATIDPYFSTTKSSLIAKGVIYAIAHVRGGGEKGTGLV